MPITYDAGTNTITVTSYTESTPCTFDDIYNADKAGTLTLVDRDGITAADTDPVDNTYNLRPADEKLMGGAKQDLWIVIENWSGFTDATIRLIGTDEGDNALQEDIVVTGNGTYYASELFKTLTQTQVVAVTGTGSFDYALVQGQWGVVWKLGSSQFQFDCWLHIGDGSTSTWVKDNSKTIVISNFYTYGGKWLYVYNSAHFTCGILEDASNKTTSRGCKFLNFLGGTIYATSIKGDQYSELNFYSCCFQSSCDFYLHDPNKVYNSLFSYRAYTTHMDKIPDLYGNTIQKSTEAIYAWANNNPIQAENVFGTDISFAAIYLNGGAGITLKNSKFRNCQHIMGTNSPSQSSYLINVDADNWNFDWGGGPEIYRQYEFDLKVIDKDENPISGATVKIWDKDNNLVTNVTTGDDGKIPTQTLNYGYYTQANGNTPTMQTPHTIEISKAGYQTYRTEFTVDEKIDWRIRLKPIRINIDNEVIV